MLVGKALKGTPTGDPLRVSPPGDSPHEPDPPVGDPGGSPGGATASSKVKLPKVSLPHFKGNLMYWDLYESAVHLNSALSDVDSLIT